MICKQRYLGKPSTEVVIDLFHGYMSTLPLHPDTRRILTLFVDGCGVVPLLELTDYLFFLFIVFPLGSMFDDIRLHVARSYTSYPDSPFSFISPLTLCSHLLTGCPLQPPFLDFLCDFPTFDVLLILSFVILSSFVTHPS